MANSISSNQPEARNLRLGSSSPRERPGGDGTRRAARYVSNARQKLVPGLTIAVVILVLVAGWLYRDEGHVAPDHGVGYWLGLLGGAAMLLLLFYPLRKRFRIVRAIGSVSGWFRLHMFLGLLGPILILFHANFKLGSSNSNVALASMLLVAGSGIVGRYIYSKIHLGLYGRKSDVREILEDAASFKSELGHELTFDTDFVETMNEFSAAALQPAKGLLRGILALTALGWRARRCRRRLLAEARHVLSAEAMQRGWSRRIRRQRFAVVQDRLTLFFLAVRKAAAFALFERLFSLWHVLHLPLFVLLIITGVLHVIAVHTF